MNQIQQLKERIYALNPEFIIRDIGGRKINVDIHLENVLRAMKLTGHEWERVTVTGNIMNFSIPKAESVTTIEEGVGINNEQYSSVTNYEWWNVDYDLTKTFDQNIAENPELVEFLLNIIK